MFKVSFSCSNTPFSALQFPTRFRGGIWTLVDPPGPQLATQWLHRAHVRQSSEQNAESRISVLHKFITQSVQSNITPTNTHTPGAEHAEAHSSRTLPTMLITLTWIRGWWTISQAAGDQSRPTPNVPTCHFYIRMSRCSKWGVFHLCFWLLHRQSCTPHGAPGAKWNLPPKCYLFSPGLSNLHRGGGRGHVCVLGVGSRIGHVSSLLTVAAWQ